MTDQETRIAIAEACGWLRIDRSGVSTGDMREWRVPIDGLQWIRLIPFDHELPNFAGSLDAMHAAEQTLSDEEFLVYSKHLSNGSASFRVDIAAVACSLAALRCCFVSATAAQRAQAFVRTIAARAEREVKP